MLFPACIWWTDFHQKQNAAFLTMIRVLGMGRSCWQVLGVQQAVPGKGLKGFWRRMRFSLEQQETAAVWQPAQEGTAGISLPLEMPLQKCDGKHPWEQPHPQLQQLERAKSAFQNALTRQGFNVQVLQTWLLLLLRMEKVKFCWGYITRGRWIPLLPPALQTPPLWVIPQCHLLSAFSHSAWVTPS